MHIYPIGKYTLKYVFSTTKRCSGVRGHGSIISKSCISRISLPLSKTISGICSWHTHMHQMQIQSYELYPWKQFSVLPVMHTRAQNCRQCDVSSKGREKSLEIWLYFFVWFGINFAKLAVVAYCMVITITLGKPRTNFVITGAGAHCHQAIAPIMAWMHDMQCLSLLVQSHIFILHCNIQSVPITARIFYSNTFTLHIP